MRVKKEIYIPLKIAEEIVEDLDEESVKNLLIEIKEGESLRFGSNKYRLCSYVPQDSYPGSKTFYVLLRIPSSDSTHDALTGRASRDDVKNKTRDMFSSFNMRWYWIQPKPQEKGGDMVFYSQLASFNTQPIPRVLNPIHVKHRERGSNGNGLFDRGSI